MSDVSKSKSDEMKKKVQGCLVGLAIGDAMGMPVETMTRQEILAVTNGQGITGFVDAIQKRFKDMAKFNAGQTTDDWQLTKAIVYSILEHGGYDLEHSLAHQCGAMKISTAGWGGTTRRSMKELYDWFESPSRHNGRKFNQPAQFTTGEGSGNGVAMKIAPIAICFHLMNGPKCANIDLLPMVMNQGLATHGDIRASLSAYAVAMRIALALDPSFQNDQADENFFDIIEELRFAEKMYLKKFVGQYPPRLGFSKKISDVFNGVWHLDLDNLIISCGNSCYCMESVPFSLAVAERNENDFRAGILEAVNSGGDTDTNAAIVGAILGANLGLDAIPLEWREFNDTFVHAAELGEKLYNLLTK